MAKKLKFKIKLDGMDSSEVAALKSLFDVEGRAQAHGGMSPEALT